MGWCANLIMIEIGKILGDRFIKYYSTADSMSAFWIVVNDMITKEEMDKITSLFPKEIRVEFETEMEKISKSTDMKNET